MASDCFGGHPKEPSDELVIPMLLMRYRYICSSAVLAYAYLHQLAPNTRELREAGLIDTAWASREEGRALCAA